MSPLPASTAPGARRRVVMAAALVAIGLVATRYLDPAPNEPPGAPAGQVVYADVAGWYRRTPDEVALLTPYDFSLDGLPAGLPLDLGPWRGEDRDVDPATARWLGHPDVAMARTYRRADGAVVWLSVFGSRGDRSYRLFEHTPEICYPLAGWSLEASGTATLPLGPRPLTVRRGVATGADGQLVVLHFYLWDSPARDPERGTLSLRVAAPVDRDADETFAMLADEFVPAMFPRSLSWSRF